MLKTLLLAVALSACVHLPHVDPQPRTPDAAERARVYIDVTCMDSYSGQDIEWYPPKSGTGVLISERHVLTAAHVVACPTIPVATVTLSDGRQFRMDVERDDAAFGSGTDVARLEIASAENFGLHIAPPQLGYFVAGDPAVAITRNPAGGMMYGTDIVVGLKTVPGDSGAGVYDAFGHLLGVVSKVADDGSYTRIAPVSKTWLEGT